MYLPASTAAINSASVELSTIVSWNRYLHSTAAPANMITILVTDLRCQEFPAQSESLIPNNVYEIFAGVQLSIFHHSCCLCKVLE